MRNISEFAPTSAGASTYWSSGPDPLLGAAPAAGGVAGPVDGAIDGAADCADAAGGDDGDDGADDDGCGAADAPDDGGELEAGAAVAAEDVEWWRVSRTNAPTPDAASNTTTTTAAIQISARDLRRAGGSSGAMPYALAAADPGTAHGSPG